MDYNSGQNWRYSNLKVYVFAYAAAKTNGKLQNRPQSLRSWNPKNINVLFAECLIIVSLVELPMKIVHIVIHCMNILSCWRNISCWRKANFLWEPENTRLADKNDELVFGKMVSIIFLNWDLKKLLINGSLIVWPE